MRTLHWAVLFLPFFGCAHGCGNAPSKRVVVYCAHDREFAEDILNDFGIRSGFEVSIRWDTEANKSVNLYEDLVREARRPRCDVHWNNEILAALRLQKQGIYEPYDSPAAAPFPAAFKAADHTWTAFAARARVLLVNTAKVNKDELPASIMDLILPRWRGQLVMAKPQFGTTATQAACLFQVWGDQKAVDFFDKLRANDIRILPGNKQVAEAVGRGQYSLGLTDTDDAMAELEAGKPVTLVFLDKNAPADSALGTLFIPNTVAVIKNSPNPAAARQLIDYLLSEEVETKLAQSASRQIPLNPRIKSALPKELATPQTVRPLATDFAQAAENWEKTQKLLLNALGPN